MKDIKKYTATLGVFIFIFCISCERLADVNKNLNDPSTVPTASLLASAQKNIMDNMRGTALSATLSLAFIQHFAHNTYTDADRYQLTNTAGSTAWQNLYMAIATLNEIIKLNTDPNTQATVSVDGFNDNQIAVCRILKVWAFQNMTDIWGDIPYHSTGATDPDFQACLADEGIIYPKYASQEKIYKDMLKELKEASDMIDVTESGFKRGDAIFGGNILRWKKFANSLSLRIANRVKAKLPEAATRITEIISNSATYPVMAGNTDNACLAYATAAPNQAPFYNYTIVARRDDYSITNTVVEYMQGTRGNTGISDPRLPFYAQKATNTGTYVGQPYGLGANYVTYVGADNVSYPGTLIYAPDFKEVLMEYAEVQFLLSENKNWEQASYIEGIKASMEKWGVIQADITLYMAAVPTATEEHVITQKWIALMMQGQEAWSEYRRTGFPDFLVMPGDIIWSGNVNGVPTDVRFEPLLGSAIPRRLFYPDTEQQLNKESYQAALAVQGNDAMDTKIWWDR